MVLTKIIIKEIHSDGDNDANGTLELIMPRSLANKYIESMINWKIDNTVSYSEADKFFNYKRNFSKSLKELQNIV